MSQASEFSLSTLIHQLSDKELEECLMSMEDGKIVLQSSLVYKLATRYFGEVYKEELLRVSTQCGIELFKRSKSNGIPSSKSE